MQYDLVQLHRNLMSNSKYNPQSHRLGGRRFSQSQSQPGEPIKLRAHLTGLIFFFFFLPHFVPIFCLSLFTAWFHVTYSNTVQCESQVGSVLDYPDKRIANKVRRNRCRSSWRALAGST